MFGFYRKVSRHIRRGFSVFTLEEHNIIGGLYSLVCEKLDKPKKIYPIAIQDTFGESGTPEELMSKYKIDADYLVKSVLETVEE